MRFSVGENYRLQSFFFSQGEGLYNGGFQVLLFFQFDMQYKALRVQAQTMHR